jgi:1-acyl-sn-glycerol-3-phosphate acyltransferase
LTPGAPRRYPSWRAVTLLFPAKLLAIAINTAVLAPLIAVVAVFDPRRAYRLSLAWAHVNLAVTGVRVRAHQTAPLDPSRGYVFMSNHASNFDPLAVVTALPDFQMRWVAKRELTRVPVFGWALRQAGHVIIDRSNPGQAMATLRATRAMMETGISVVIFPEGTREGHDHEVLPLKRGGFVLAVETGAPIVPLAVRGSRAILPRDDWRIHGGEIDVVVGAPIATAGADVDALAARVRAFFVEHMDAAPPAPVLARVAEAR